MRAFGEPVAEVSITRTGVPYAWTFRGRRYTGGLIDHWVDVPDRRAEPAPNLDDTQKTEHWLLHASSDVGQGLAELSRAGEVIRTAG